MANTKAEHHKRVDEALNLKGGRSNNAGEF